MWLEFVVSANDIKLKPLRERERQREQILCWKKLHSGRTHFRQEEIFKFVKPWVESGRWGMLTRAPKGRLLGLLNRKTKDYTGHIQSLHMILSTCISISTYSFSIQIHIHLLVYNTCKYEDVVKPCNQNNYLWQVIFLREKYLYKKWIEIKIYIKIITH